MANPEITTGNSWSVFSPADPTELDSDYVIYTGWWNSENHTLFYIVDNTTDSAVWVKAVFE